MNTVEPVHEPDNSRFVVRLESGEAVLVYRLENGQIVFTHTFVPEAARGMGIADRLVSAGIDYAKAAGLEPIGECSYVKSWLRHRAKH